MGVSHMGDFVQIFLTSNDNSPKKAINRNGHPIPVPGKSGTEAID